MLKTKDGRSIDVKVLSYNELINEIMTVDTNLAEVLKQVSQDNEKTKFYKASYKFGDKIIGEEECYLPLVDGGNIAFDDSQLPDVLRSDLSYNAETEDPLGLIMSKSSEFYLRIQDRILPNRVVTPGSMFGVTRAIDVSSNIALPSIRLRNLNAGARSLFMLRKIGNNIRHSKLQRKYNVCSLAPQTMQEHWQIFVDIANNIKSEWRSEVIFFPREWINKLKTPEYIALTLHLVHKRNANYDVWQQLGQMWNISIGEIEQDRDLANLYQPYSLATTRHLFAIASNSATAFRPAMDNEMAPIQEIQQAYGDAYYALEKQNSKYSLLIMEPAHFNSKDRRPVYYSPNYSTFEQVKPEISNGKTQIAILQEVLRTSEAYRQGILTKKKSITSLYNVARDTEFTFFHSKPTDYKSIATASLIAEGDSRFTKEEMGEFPKDSPFFTGCIRISHKN